MKEEILAKHVKKILRWGNGLAIFITKECRKLGWNEGEFISTSVMKDEKGERILIKKVKVA
jgi:antitoxin component of MazEF toxin-antitoxin module